MKAGGRATIPALERFGRRSDTGEIRRHVGAFARAGGQILFGTGAGCLDDCDPGCVREGPPHDAGRPDRLRGGAPTQGIHPSPPNSGQIAHEGIVASWALILAMFRSCFIMYWCMLAVSDAADAGLGSPFFVRSAR